MSASSRIPLIGPHFFAMIVVFTIFDIASDWNFYATVDREVKKFEDTEAFVGSPVPAGALQCACTTCSDTVLCQGPSNTAALCNSLVAFDARSGGDNLCRVSEMTSVVEAGGSCSYTFAGSVSEDLDRLKNIRLTALIINVLSTVIAIVYLLYEGHRRNIAFQMAEDGSGAVDEGPETAPCPNCGDEQPIDHKNCTSCGSNMTDTSLVYAARIWFRGVRHQAHLRILILAVEDVPQLVLVLLYVTTVAEPAGLQCQQCMLGGGACDYGSGLNEFAIWFSIAATLLSTLTLLAQVIFTNHQTNKKTREGKYDKKFKILGGPSVFTTLVVVGMLIGPIFIILISTDLKTLLNLSPAAQAGFAVVTAVVLIPLLVLMCLFGCVATGECETCCGCDLCNCDCMEECFGGVSCCC